MNTKKSVIEWLRHADLYVVSTKDRNEFALVITPHTWAGGTCITKEHGSDTFCIESTVTPWHRYSATYMRLDAAGREEFARRLDACCRRAGVYHRLNIADSGMSILVGHVYDIDVIGDLDGPVGRIGVVVDAAEKVQRLVDRVLGPIAMPGTTSMHRRRASMADEAEKSRELR